MRHLLLVLAAALAAAPAHANPDLPRPESLEPNVRFWTRVYTEVDTSGGILHDSEEVGVVYEVLRLPEGLGTRTRERRVESAKKRYRAILKKLGRGERKGLSDEERRVLALWPLGSSDSTFRKAASRVRFQLGQADKFRAGLARSGQWSAHIEQTLAEHGVPRELVALPHVESSFNPRAYSRVGAAGMWQFMRSTGRLYMRVDDVVDERMDPHQATVGAARLLRDNQRRLKAWPLAITAYNHGVAGMERAVRATGTRDIGVIARRYTSRIFGFASRNFYAEFLAASQIHEDPERYFGPITPERPVEYEVLVTDHYYRAPTLGRALGIDLDVLRDHNLALRPAVWNGAKHVPKGYALRIPRHELREPIVIAMEKIPDRERYSAQKRDRFHKVRRGETLSAIARRYGVRESELVAVNGLRSRHRIRVGQVLRLPTRLEIAPIAVAKAEKPQPAASANEARPTVLAASVAPASGSSEVVPAYYEVRRGDTLSRIASRFGMSERELASRNGLRNRHRIRVGQRLRVATEEARVATAHPGPGAAAAESSASAAADTRESAAADTREDAAAPEPIVLAAAPAPEKLAARAPEEPSATVAAEVAPAPESSARTSPPESAPAAPLEIEAELAEEVTPPPVPDEPAVAVGAGDAAIEAGQVPGSEDARLAEAVVSEAPGTALAPATGRPPAPDPSNYAVSADHRIIVHADETLGHYAEWLEVSASRLRRINGMSIRTPLVIGRQRKLDFSHVTPEVFEQRRLEYHRTIQEEFFEAWEVTGTTTHPLSRGETLWQLSRQRYEIPMWLLVQYNPDLDFGALTPGTTLVVPIVGPRAG